MLKMCMIKCSVPSCFLCICSITEHVNEKLSNPLFFHRFRKFLSKLQTHPNQCEFHKTYENPMDFATFNLHVQHGIKCVENKIQWGASNVLFFFQQKWNSTELGMLFWTPRWTLKILLKCLKTLFFHIVFTGLVSLLRAWFWWCIIAKRKTSKPLNLLKLNEKQLFKRISK